jgi:perosamine synthetase
MSSVIARKSQISVPFFKPVLGEPEIDEVVDTLRSGWLTTGPKVKQFEALFAEAVNATQAIAVNSCTAALHLAVEALGLKPNQAVLVPTLTFAATAEVIRYQGAVPILVDCDPDTLNIDLSDASRKLEALRSGRLLESVSRDIPVVGIIPVHVGGLMVDIDSVQRFAEKNDLWVIEDAAHAFPAAWRRGPDHRWQRCGENTSTVTCFSFYANKTITTGEGGMAVTSDAEIAGRMRMMSLHGLSHDAWGRYSGGGWDYRIVAPGFKYNLTDIAAAIGIHQLARAEAMRRERETIAGEYLENFAGIEQIEMPPTDDDRIHSWHLFPIKLNLDRLTIDRSRFIEELKQSGIGCSVHWRPLHMHPYYSEFCGWREEDFPVATRQWQRLVSLPLFPGMNYDHIDHVIRTVREVCSRYGC